MRLSRIGRTPGIQKWMRFDLDIGGCPLEVFADSGATNCFIARRIVERLGLELQQSTGRVRLEGGKAVDILGAVTLPWSYGSFSTITNCIVLDMDHDLILGEDFWIEHRLVPDYDTMGVRIQKDGVEHRLQGAKNTCALQILENVPTEFSEINRRGFERLLRKGAQACMYVVRAEPDSPERLDPVQKTTGHKELDRVLGPRLLERLQNDLPKRLPPDRPLDHTIETGDARPINRAHYSLSPEQNEEQKRQIQYLTERKLIRPSQSPWGAPVLFAKKKDGSWRMCIDYRGLNSVTQKNGYPLPKIQDCLDAIGKAKCFSKIDLTSGYWQINVVDKDRTKTAFNTKAGKYEFMVMPFGLTNAPATFQTIMNDLLRPFLDDFVVVYLDDILIYSDNEEEHLQHVKAVMEKLEKEKLFAKPSKCEFFQKYVEFCGHIVGNGEVRMDASKVKAIREWPPLQTVHDVRSFLGLCAYYRRFIEDFATICGPLYELIRGSEGKKYKPVVMNYQARASYDLIKHVITSEKVLAQPDTKLPFIIETDASDFGWGAVLYQADADGVEHPIAFESKGFTSAEANYATHERELLAIKESLRRWRCYIENGTTTTVRTDHKGLQYLQTQTQPSGRLARWLAEFGEYKLDIKYKPGSEMTVPDTLSRRGDFQLLTGEVNDRTLSFDQAIRAYAEFGTLPDDPEMRTELEKFEHHLRVDDDSIQYRDTPQDSWVPYTPVWARTNFLDHIHKQYGHCSHETMMDIIRVRQWWPGMRKDIKHYVKHCHECQLAAVPRDVKRDVMHPSGTWKDRSNPFERWGFDLIGPLPETERGNKWIVTAIDYATRWPVAQALPDATAETLAEFVVHRIYRDYGSPKEIITDRGANLWAPAMEEAYDLLGAKHRGTTPYHPRTNGAVERFNGVIGKMLTKYCIGQPRKAWDLYLDQALFATRIRTHTTTGFSPFYLLYGVNPTLPSDASGPSPEGYEERIDPAPFLSRDRAQAFKDTMARAKTNEKAWNAKVKADAFAKGDMVLIRTKIPQKFEVDWYGPYEVVQAEILNTYIVKPPGKSPNKYLISGDRMKRCHVDGDASVAWRLPRGRGRPRKVAVEQPPPGEKRKRGRPRRVQPVEDPDGEYLPPFRPADEKDLHEDGDEEV